MPHQKNNCFQTLFIPSLEHFKNDSLSILAPCSDLKCCSTCFMQRLDLEVCSNPFGILDNFSCKACTLGHTDNVILQTVLFPHTNLTRFYTKS